MSISISSKIKNINYNNTNYNKNIGIFNFMRLNIQSVNLSQFSQLM